MTDKPGASKVALVTGAARGLGTHVCEALVAAGYDLAGLDRREALLRARMEELATRGVRTLALPADLSDEAQVRGAIAKLFEHFGHVDLLVSNAGVRELAPVWEMSTQLWERTMASNLGGAFLCTRELLAGGMLERDRGRLIYISSDAGTAGSQRGAAYCASKWGLRGFAASVARDLADTQIRVTTLLPGMIETPMARESEAWGLVHDWLDPRRVAEAVVFCAQADATVHIPELELHHRSNF